MLFIRRLTLLALRYNFHILAQHIPGPKDGIADALCLDNNEHVSDF